MLALLASGCHRRERPVLPVRKDITQAVYASGKAYPLRYYRVVPSVPGYLEKLLAQVGDTVVYGQPLFTMRNQVGSFNLEASRTTLEQARRNADYNSPILRAAREELAVASEKLKLDSLQYARYQSLQQAGAGTRQALDIAKTQYTTSLATYQRAKESLEATRQRVETERDNAQAAYHALQAGQDNYTVYASLSGQVYDQVPKVGEYIGPTTVVMEIGETTAFEVELAIDESDLNYVHKGQKVYFSAEALGKSLATGVIQRVYPKISAQSKSIKAIASLVLPAGKTVFAGSTLEANIVCATRKNALVLPKLYVHGDSVTVRAEGKFQKIPIKTGLEDADFVEVLGGITPETEVYKAQ